MANENVDNVEAVESQPGTVESESTTTTAETSLGLDENVASALAYLFGFISGIVVFLLEQDNQHVRFHGAQSVVLSVVVIALSITLSVVGTILDIVLTGWMNLLVWLAFSLGSLGVTVVAFVAWLYLIVRAFQGANPRIPLVAGLADSIVK